MWESRAEREAAEPPRAGSAGNGTSITRFSWPSGAVVGSVAEVRET